MTRLLSIAEETALNVDNPLTCDVDDLSNGVWEERRMAWATHVAPLTLVRDLGQGLALHHMAQLELSEQSVSDLW